MSNTNVTIEEMVSMKKDLTVELLKAQFKGLAVDMTATIEYLQQSIAWLDAEIKKEELNMNKKTVIGVGKIVNGRLTYVSTKGGVSRPLSIKGKDFDGEPEVEVLEGEVIDVRFPVEMKVQEGADFDDAPEGLKMMEELRHSVRGQKGLRFPLGSDLVHGADFDETAEGLKLMEQLRKGGK